MGQHLPPDHSKGDANTIGGYMAVHDRPAAFEGSDGFSYSVEILAEEYAEPGRWGGYLLFVQWARIGASAPVGHLESPILVESADEAAARAAVGQLPLAAVKQLLDELIADRRGGAPKRRWWDAMHAEEE